MYRVHVATGAPIEKPGGLHRYVLDLATAQKRAGDRVCVLHQVTRSGKFTVHPSFDEFEVSHDPGRTLVHFHFAPSALAVLLGRSRTFSGTGRVFHFHGPWAGEGRVQGNGRARVAAKRLIERLAYANFDSFITASESFASVLSQSYGIPESRVRSVTPGVDVARFADRTLHLGLRERLGLREGDKLVGSGRRLEPRMGLDYAIRAIALLSGEVHLAIAGQGSERARLEKVAADLGVTERVHFLGRLSDAEVVAFFQEVDLTVVPTLELEGFGLVVLESYAAGTPVVSTNCDGLVEAMGPFAGDWTCPSRDSSALASLISRGLATPPGSGQISDYARSMDTGNFADRVDVELAALRALP